ncbi:MAG: hypothetical protein ACXVEE_21345 [Polyangiales bacterium]
MLSVRLLAGSILLAAGVGFVAPACGGTVNSASTDGTGDPSHPIMTPGGDMPCEIAAVIANCTGCHSNPPTQAAPMPLISYADLTAASPDYPGQSYAQRALARMQDPAAPMPPKPADPLTADQITTFKNWVDSGMPQSTCDNPAAPIDAGPDPYATPPVCTSGKNWTLGNRGSSSMRPGVPCIACHQMSGGEAPLFAVAGTVYPTAHEPDNCMSAVPAGSTTVVITEADGKTTHTLPVNAAGNFYYSDRTGTFKTPYKAKVVSGGKERAMTTAQTDGDCNNCHTQAGANSAPGRITIP